MGKEKLNQMKIDLETDIEASEQNSLEQKDVEQEPSSDKNKKTKKKTKKIKEPQTISIEENYYIDEDGDKIAPPNREIFEDDILTREQVKKDSIFEYVRDVLGVW